MAAPSPFCIAHTLLSLCVGGLERVAVDLANAAGPAIKSLFICLDTSGPMARELRDPSTRVLEFNRTPGFRPWLAWPLSRILRAQNASLVHTHNTAAGFYGALAGRLARIPVVHTKHGQNLSGGNQRAVNRLAYLLTDRVVAVSQAAEKLARSEGAPPDKLSIIDNGVDITRFSDVGRQRVEARGRLGVTEGDLVLGTVGRLAAVKNQRMLIESGGDATTESGRRIVLVIVGDGPEKERLVSAGRAAPKGLRVVLAGEQRVEDWLPAFDVFALTSDSEGLPVALLEAMACRVPAIVTGVGAMPQVVDHGHAGVVVPAGDRAALAEAITALNGDAERRIVLAEAGFRRVQARYSAERMARDYEVLYRWLLGFTPATGPA